MKAPARFTKIALIVIASLWMSPGHAAISSCRSIFEIHPEIAKEIEIYNSSRLMSLLTTEDGRLMSLVPVQSREEMRTKFGSQVDQLKWQNASEEERQTAVELLAAHVNFADSRTIPGLIAPQQIRFTPERDFVFEGQTFQEGKPAVANLSGFLLPMIEYAGGGFVKNAGALEFHFRGTSPKKLDESVRLLFQEILPNAESNVQNSSVKTPSSDHLHIVAMKPSGFVEKLRAEGVSKTGIVRALATYHTLVELDMILTSRAAGMHALPEIKEENKPPLFSFLQQSRIGELVNFYRAASDGENLDINKYSEQGTALKKNFAGARWGTAYSDHNLWGIELRFPGFSTSQQFAALAEGVKKTLDSQDFRIRLERVKAMELLTEDEFESRLWFSTSPTENVAKISDPHLKELATRALKNMGGDSAFLSSWGNQKNFSHKLLGFFDWSSHPLFASFQANKQMILNAQTTLLAKAVNNQSFSDKDLDEFFQNSGIRDYLNLVVERRPH